MAALIAIGSLVLVVFSLSLIAVAREKSMFALAQLIGSIFLMVVVFAHVAEQFRILPAMGWGQAESAGHYLDLMSAVAGSILFTFRYLSRRLGKRRLATGRAISEYSQPCMTIAVIPVPSSPPPSGRSSGSPSASI